MRGAKSLMESVKETMAGMVVKSMGPDEAELRKINQYTRRTYGPDDLYTFTIVLCDNQVDRDFERFSGESLKTLREMFLGKTCILDHERKSHNQTARIYHTELVTEKVLTDAGEPLQKLMARAYLPRTEGNAETIELIDSGILKEVSVSCSVKHSQCSICGKESCQHEKGRSYNGKLAHRVLMEPTDAYECSFVAVPAQRGAGVTKSFEGGVEKLLREPPKEGAELSCEQLRKLWGRLEQLSKQARWGEIYRRDLEKSTLRYSGIVQPEMPREVMEKAMSGLELEELQAMAKTYERMADKRIPIRPQLMPVREEDGGKNAEFRI